MRKPAVAMDGIAYEEAALTAYVAAATKGALCRASGCCIVLLRVWVVMN